MTHTGILSNTRNNETIIGNEEGGEHVEVEQARRPSTTNNGRGEVTDSL